MVVIHVKDCEADGFLFETSCDTSNDQLIREIVEVWNLRQRLRQLCGSLRDLIAYGPMKPADKTGIDSFQEKYNNASLDKNDFYQEDPSGVRTGNRPGPSYSNTIELVVKDAEAALDTNLVSKKIPTSLAFLHEKLDNMRGAVTIAYPMGLPSWDIVRLTLEGSEGMQGTMAGQQLLDPATAELWVASRPFNRDQTVADRLGKNEKTKVVAKLQRAGGGPPGREPGVSEEEKKAMMAYYFKKQEELKQLAENDEDEYLKSSWADPKQLQRSLRGQSSGVKAPGLRL